MEVIPCRDHNKPCMLKTGVKEGDSFGKSFYICGSVIDRCNFVKEAWNVEPRICSVHAGSLVDLQLIHVSARSRERRHYHRCVIGRREKLNWCGYWLLEKNMVSELQSRGQEPQNDVPAPMKDISVNQTVSVVPMKADPVKGKQPPSEGTNPKMVEKLAAEKQVSSTNTTNKKEKRKEKSTSDRNPAIHPTSDTKLDSDVGMTTPPKQMMSFSEISQSAKAKSKTSGVAGGDDDCMIVDSPSFATWRQRPEPGRDRNVDKSRSILAPRPTGAQVITVGQPLGGATSGEGAAKTQVITIKKPSTVVTIAPAVARDVDRNQPPSTTRMVTIVKPVASSQGGASSVGSTSAGVGNFDMNIYMQTLREKDRLTSALTKHTSILRTANVKVLPDGGAKLRDKITELTSMISQLELSVKRQQQVAAANKAAGVSVASMAQTKPRPVAIAPTQPANTGPRQAKLTEYTQAAPLSQFAYQQMYASNPQAALYGGRMTAARLQEVGHVTTEALERLHIQLESLPAPDKELDDPAGLTIPLMTHQRQALTWLTWREKQHPPGGILADDMGLGKTLTLISLVLKQREGRKAAGETGEKEKKEKEDWLARKTDNSVLLSDATLIVCPASLVHQWAKEIERRCQRRLLKVVIYHGPNREHDVLKLAKADVVLTTYNIVSKEVGVTEDMKNDKHAHEKPATDSDVDGATSDQSKLLRVAWGRIVLDEAHSIKNHKSLTALAMCRLRARSRWALTGTPIQNDLLDMYSLLRFLRCSPFDEYKLWKRQVDNKSAKGTQRLNMLVKTLLLRRTKGQTGAGGKPLVALPEKHSIIHQLELSVEERIIYEKIFAQSRATMQRYIQKHEDKELIGSATNMATMSTANPWANEDTRSLPGPQQSCDNSRPLLKQSNTQNGGSQMLLLLLRLRQCCCHLSLMKDALDAEALQADGLDLDIVQQMRDMAVADTAATLADPDIVQKLSDQFEVSHTSTKISAVMKELETIRDQSPKGRPMKSVIVSQWTSMLMVMEHHVHRLGLRCCTIRGDVPALKRMELVEAFNTDPDGPQVMLVSLRAGGCGLNLIGGNHLFLVDLHWNPALETQACDRIYRLGQKKDVFIHKFLCQDTVEEKIAQLQKRKISLAHNVLTGAGASANKLTLADLKMLFGLDTEVRDTQMRPYGPVRL